MTPAASPTSLLRKIERVPLALRRALRRHEPRSMTREPWQGIVWVCRTCGLELVRVESCIAEDGDSWLYASYICPTHGEMSFAVMEIA